MIDWDDLRFFLAAARSRSFAEAGVKLAADTATVSRRVLRLEAALKTTLFTRSRTGLQLTGAGRSLLPSAERAEAHVNAIVTESADVGGVVRVSASEGFGTAILAPALPAFSRSNPTITIELAAQSSFLSPDNREADVAITLSAQHSQRLITEPFADYTLGLFASAAYLRQRSAPRSLDDLRGHDMIGYVDDLIYAPELRYLEELLPGLRPRVGSSSINAQREIVRAGGGICVLPHFLADDDLVPVLPHDVVIRRRFWIATHKEVAETARVRATRRWLLQTRRSAQARLCPAPLPIPHG